jgi:16S rRNA (guanine527-N7)-methyltransferase
MDSMRSETFRGELDAALVEFGISALEEGQIGRLCRHYEMMIEWNERLNLTRITDPRDAARLHYAESLYAARLIGDEKTLLDIGSGAGFPVLPLAVMRQDVAMTALESNKKKALFLNEVKADLGLTNLSVMAARLEEVDLRSFDLLTCRALDRAEQVLPRVAKRLGPAQRLILFGGTELLERMRRLPVSLSSHPIPGSDRRFVATVRCPTSS